MDDPTMRNHYAMDEISLDFVGELKLVVVNLENHDFISLQVVEIFHDYAISVLLNLA